MATTQYTGARYVPVFADPAEWNDTRTYEPLTIVLHEGNSYTSAQYVPMGIDISNEKFWKLTGNYNSQVEQYRQDVTRYATQVNTVSAELNAEIDRATNADKVLNDNLRAEIDRATNADKSLQNLVNTSNNMNYSSFDVYPYADIYNEEDTDFYNQGLTYYGNTIYLSMSYSDNTKQIWYQMDVTTDTYKRFKTDIPKLHPEGLCVNPETGNLYSLSIIENKIYEFNPSDMTLVKTHVTPKIYYGMLATEDGVTYYTFGSSSQSKNNLIIYKLDANFAIVDTYTFDVTGLYNQGGCIHDGVIYVGTSHSIIAVDMSTMTIIGNVTHAPYFELEGITYVENTPIISVNVLGVPSKNVVLLKVNGIKNYTGFTTADVALSDFSTNVNYGEKTGFMCNPIVATTPVSTPALGYLLQKEYCVLEFKFTSDVKNFIIISPNITLSGSNITITDLICSNLSSIYLYSVNLKFTKTNNLIFSFMYASKCKFFNEGDNFVQPNGTLEVANPIGLFFNGKFDLHQLRINTNVYNTRNSLYLLKNKNLSTITEEDTTLDFKSINYLVHSTNNIIIELSTSKTAETSTDYCVVKCSPMHSNMLLGANRHFSNDEVYSVALISDVDRLIAKVPSGCYVHQIYFGF